MRPWPAGDGVLCQTPRLSSGAPRYPGYLFSGANEADLHLRLSAEQWRLVSLASVPVVLPSLAPDQSEGWSSRGHPGFTIPGLTQQSSASRIPVGLQTNRSDPGDFVMLASPSVEVTLRPIPEGIR